MSVPDEYQLYADPFTPEEQSELAGLNCGEEPWSRAATDWIRGSEVLDSIAKFNTTVWLYRDHQDSIVGFASLAATAWQRWPPPDGKRSRLLYLPQLGIDVKYRGFPPAPDWRYSRQILEHVLHKAKGLAIQIRSEKPPSKHVELLTLKVHRDNEPAQKLYSHYGFERLATFDDQEHLTMSHRLDLGDH